MPGLSEKIKRPRITSGISQIGGKYRLLNEILKRIPYHEFYLEPFLGSAIVLLNKNRCRYECGNDLNSELINYLLVASGWDKGVQDFTSEFRKVKTFTYDAQVVNMYEEMKQGVFGLVSQEICNRIVRGELVPRNNIERAYFYYYLNKLTFGGGIWMVRKEPPWKGIDPNDQAGKFSKHFDRDPTVEEWCNDIIEEGKQKKSYETSGGQHGIISRTGGFMNRDTDIAKAKKSFKMATKGYIGLIDNQTMSKDGYGRVDSKVVDKAKAQYSGILNNFALGTLKEKQCEEAKANYRGVVPKTGFSYTGIVNHGTTGRIDKPTIEKAKKNYKNATHKGINPKTTRPYTNNDCGLLSPLNPKAIKRLRYVNLTTYPFQKVYDMFYKAFHVRKGLNHECFLYIDRPFPGTEKYYKSGFGKEEHEILNNIILESPFHILESLGGKCEWIIDSYKDAGLIIEEVSVKYSTDATSQKKSKEYLIMNYDINQLPKMVYSSDQKLMEAYF